MLAAIIALALPAGAQSVISTHAGVIHFFEGNVYLGDQALESHLGRYLTVPQGAELRTAAGRAEVLLTPGVFLRVGEQTSIRMLATDLADTQVELEAGSAIVDSAEPNAGTSVSLVYRGWKVHFLQKGVYRLDSDPARLLVTEGQAEVFAAGEAQPVMVERGMSLPLSEVLVPEAARAETEDSLSEWSDGRGESITADNAITAQIDEDPSQAGVTPGLAGMGGVDGFTYFPMLGVPALGLGAYSQYSPYSGLANPLQLGFNSIYLPGYTYRPLILGPAGRGIGLGRGLGTYVPSTTRGFGVTTPGFTTPRGFGGVVSTPRAPVVIRPVAPVAPRAGAVHVGGHR